MVMDRQGLPYGGNACQRGGYRSRPVAAFPAFPGKAAGSAEKAPAPAMVMAGHGAGMQRKEICIRRGTVKNPPSTYLLYYSRIKI